MRSSRVVLVLLAVLAIPSITRAQFQEQVNVEIVDVPVYVVQHDGVPVAGLTKDAFDLYVNGKRVNIDYFDPIDFSTSAATPSSLSRPESTAPRDIRDRRLFLLLFDFSSGNPHVIARARDGARAMLKQASPSDLFAVATYGSRYGLEFVTPFVSDREATLRAITSLRPSEAHDPLELTISKPERLLLDQQSDDTTPAGTGDLRHSAEPRIPAGLEKLIDGEKELAKMPMQRLFEDQLNDFKLLATRLAQLDGYKHVVLLSTSFPVPLGDPALYRKYEAMRRAFLASNAMIDTIDLNVNDPFSNQMHFGSEGLHGVARDTGGLHIHNENPISKAFARVNAMTMTGYRLGFKMPTDAKRAYNAIEVKVRNLPANTDVIFRRGFSRDVGKPSSIDALRLADIIMNDIPQTGVAPRIAFRERPYLDVDVPSSALAGGGDAEVLLYVFDAKGAAVDFKEKKITAGGVVRTKLDLAPGDYVAKALLRVGDSVGFSRVAFVIPRLGGGGAMGR